MSLDPLLDLGLYLDKLMAPQPQGPRDPSSLDEDRGTRRRLDKDTSPDDENARSAVLLRFPCEQWDSSVSSWLKKTLDAGDLPERVIAK